MRKSHPLHTLTAGFWHLQDLGSRILFSKATVHGVAMQAPDAYLRQTPPTNSAHTCAARPRRAMPCSHCFMQCSPLRNMPHCQGVPEYMSNFLSFAPLHHYLYVRLSSEQQITTIAASRSNSWSTVMLVCIVVVTGRLVVTALPIQSPFPFSVRFKLTNLNCVLLVCPSRGIKGFYYVCSNVIVRCSC